MLGSRRAIRPDGKLAEGAAGSPITYRLRDPGDPASVWTDVKIKADGKRRDPNDEIGQMGMDHAVKFFSDVKERFWIKEKAAPYGGSLS